MWLVGDGISKSGFFAVHQHLLKVSFSRFAEARSILEMSIELLELRMKRSFEQRKELKQRLLLYADSCDRLARIFGSPPPAVDAAVSDVKDEEGEDDDGDGENACMEVTEAISLGQEEDRSPSPEAGLPLESPAAFTLAIPCLHLSSSEDQGFEDHSEVANASAGVPSSPEKSAGVWVIEEPSKFMNMDLQRKEFLTQQNGLEFMDEKYVKKKGDGKAAELPTKDNKKLAEKLPAKSDKKPDFPDEKSNKEVKKQKTKGDGKAAEPNLSKKKTAENKSDKETDFPDWEALMKLEEIAEKTQEQKAIAAEAIEEDVENVTGSPDWDRWLAMEEVGKMKASKKEPMKKKKKKMKTAEKKKGVKRPLPGDEGEEATYIFPEYSLDDQQPAEESLDKERDEFEEIMRDFPYDSIWRDFPREWSKKIVEDDCDHEFTFTDDIGKVCVDCGKVAQLVTQTYDFPVQMKRKTLKRQKLEDGEKDYGVESTELRDDWEELDESEVLNPIDHHAKRMHEHQIEGFRFLFKNLFGKTPGGAFLHHAPGTGKTFLVISFLQSYFFRFPTRRALISAPKNMLEPWQREIEKWQFDPIPTKILAGENALGKFDFVSRWYQGTGVLLVTPQLLANTIDGAGGRTEDGEEIRRMLIEGPDLLVVDEAHYARTATTKIFNTLKNIRTRQRIFLSGTAFQNSLLELFDLLNLCRSNFLAGSPEFETFAEIYKTRNTRHFFKEEVLDRMEFDREGAIRTFRSLTKPFVQWYGGKVLEKLPGLEDFVVVLKLSETHLAKVKAYTRSIRSRNPVSDDYKLSRACVHPCLSEETAVVHCNQSPLLGTKTAFIFELLEYVRRMRERVIVFSQYRASLRLLKQMLKEQLDWSENEETLQIDGETSLEDRLKITDVFNDERSRARILLASLKTCGEGISLVGGSRVVILDIAWNPAVVRQAISRAYRIGQKKKVFVYRLLASKTEETEKLRSSLQKDKLARAVFDTEFDFAAATEMVPVEDTTQDMFLDGFLDKDADRCEGIYVTP